MSEATSMTLHLTIHALSTWNEAGRRQGHCDPPLSDRGHRMAEAMAAREDLAAVRTIWTSDLKRAMDTARPLARRLGLVAVAMEQLREGRWPNHDHDSDFPPKPCSYDFEDAEAVTRRGHQVLDRILAERPADPLLIVSHGAFQRHLLSILFPDRMATYKGTRTAITTLRRQEGQWAVLAWEDAHHVKAEHTRHARADAG